MGLGNGTLPAVLCDAPLLRAGWPTVVPSIYAAWESLHPAPWERDVDRLAKHWDRCAKSGGRLWEVQSADSGIDGGLTLCAHRSCSKLEVEGRLWRIHLPRLTGKQAVAAATALELAHWRQLHLDFVLAGFEKCGTSSLSHNMARHPQVEFVPEVLDDPAINTDSQEAQDGNFFWFVGSRLLPPAELVASFNRGDCCEGGAMPILDAAAARSSKAPLQLRRSGRTQLASGLRRVRGERNPVYAFHRFIMKAISLVPGAKVVLVACDPVGWLHSAYADTTNWYAGEPGDPPRPPLSAFATAEMVQSPRPTSLSQNGYYNLGRRRALFSLFARGLMQLFGPNAADRIHLLHRDSVDERRVGEANLRDAYGRIVKFLGLQEYPEGFHFEQRNVGKVGPQQVARLGRSTLCAPSEAKSLATLKHYYRYEYRSLPNLLRLLGGSVPERLQNNRTYCDQ